MIRYRASVRVWNADFRAEHADGAHLSRLFDVDSAHRHLATPSGRDDYQMNTPRIRFRLYSTLPMGGNEPAPYQSRIR